MLASRAPSQLVQFERESSTSGAWEATPGSAPASARALVVRGQRQSAGAATETTGGGPLIGHAANTVLNDCKDWLGFVVGRRYHDSHVAVWVDYESC
ncbi:hypothetical protein M0657_011106 [Pyricularia oryzae]|nr:hypothetical protein M9X92_011294 [Pyricularia oryzae]KAI7911101.1 hypothetical protein M0657_011106 [Pyricularia oryzae]